MHTHQCMHVYTFHREKACRNHQHAISYQGPAISIIQSKLIIAILELTLQLQFLRFNFLRLLACTPLGSICCNMAITVSLLEPKPAKFVSLTSLWSKPFHYKSKLASQQSPNSSVPTQITCSTKYMLQIVTITLIRDSKLTPTSIAFLTTAVGGSLFRLFNPRFLSFLLSQLKLFQHESSVYNNIKLACYLLSRPWTSLSRCSISLQLRPE